MPVNAGSCNEWDSSVTVWSPVVSPGMVESAFRQVENTENTVCSSFQPLVSSQQLRKYFVLPGIKNSSLRSEPANFCISVSVLDLWLRL